MPVLYRANKLNRPVFTLGFCTLKRQGVGCMFGNSSALCQAASGYAVWRKGLNSKVF